MRVIGGTLGSRRLRTLVGSSTRPTADRVREALFSRLESRYDLSGRRVLDLYAGSGALGIEAMSRGALELVAVERSREAARVIADNLSCCGLDGRSQVMVCGAAEAIGLLERAGEPFDAVFMDPPYSDPEASGVFRTLAGSGLLSGQAFVVWESSAGAELPACEGGLVKGREDTYGDTKLTLYETEEEQ